MLHEIKQVAVEVVQESQFKNAKELTLSDEGWNHIKNEEKLKLKAYQIGDGMITVGYGHAERVGDSKYKLGQEISKEEAERMLQAIKNQEQKLQKKNAKKFEAAGGNPEKDW